MTSDKLKLVALKVLQENMVMLSIMELFILISGLRMVNGIVVPYTNWRFLMAGAVLVPGSYFAIRFVIQLLQDASDATRERNGNLIYSGTIGYRVLFLAVVLLFLVLSIGEYIQNGHRHIGGIVFDAVMLLLVFYGWPRQIQFSDGAILQRKIIGGMKSILYSDVTGARYDARQQCILISSKNGIRLVHSMFHAGRDQLVLQLKVLTGVTVVGLNG
jgi:hypothetical protein